MLVLHVAAGSAALVVGPLALVGLARALLPYRVLVVVVGLSALELVMSSTLPGVVRGLLALVAVGSAVGALAPSVRALRASYVALVAAVAFVSAPVWVGVAVVAVGSAVAHAVPVRAAVRAAVGRR